MDRTVDRDVDKIVDLDVSQEIEDDNGSDSSKDDDEERLVDVPFVEYNSNVDEEIQDARDKIKKYVQLKKTMQGTNGEHDGQNGDDNQDGNGDGRQITNVEDKEARNTMRHVQILEKSLVMKMNTQSHQTQVVVMKPVKILLQMMQNGIGQAERFMTLLCLWMISSWTLGLRI